MKLSELISSYTANMRLKARLKEDIQLNCGTVLKKGTVSALLIDKGNGEYHFEAENTACTVIASELEFI